MKNTWIVACLIIPGIVSPCLAADARAKQSGTEVLNRAGVEWDRWREIKSGRFSGYAFFGSDNETTGQLRREKVLEWIDELKKLVNVDAPLEAFDHVTKPLFPGLATDQDHKRPLGGWNQFRMIQDGELVRYDTILANGKVQSRTRSPEGEQNYDPGTRQATLYGLSSSFRITGISDFLFVPPVRQYKVDWTVTAQPDKTLILKGNSLKEPHPLVAELTVNPETGFVSHFMQTQILDKATRTLAEERFHIGEVATDIGIPVEQMTVHIVYDKSPDPSAHIVMVHCVTAQELSVEISREEFIIGAPAGTTVVKNDAAAGPGKRLPAFSEPNEIKDLRTLQHDPRFDQVARAQSQQERFSQADKSKKTLAWSTIIYVNVGVIVTVLGGVYWVRRHRG